MYTIKSLIQKGNTCSSKTIFQSIHAKQQRSKQTRQRFVQVNTGNMHKLMARVFYSVPHIEC